MILVMDDNRSWWSLVNNDNFFNRIFSSLFDWYGEFLVRVDGHTGHHLGKQTVWPYSDCDK